MPSTETLALVALALAAVALVLAAWFAVRLNEVESTVGRAYTRMLENIRDSRESYEAMGRVVDRVEQRLVRFEARPVVHLPSPAAEARVTEMVAIGHSVANARSIAQLEVFEVDEPAVGDEMPHSRLPDVAAFSAPARKA